MFAPFFVGTVASTNSTGELLYRSEPSVLELRSRIEFLYEPYLRAVDRAVSLVRHEHDPALVLDMHSFGMPLDADIVLGDGNGVTATTAVVDAVAEAFERVGFRVARNLRFSGGWIVRRFSDLPEIDAVQIEVNQRCYADSRAVEEQRRPLTLDSAKFRETAGRLCEALTQICSPL